MRRLQLALLSMLAFASGCNALLDIPSNDTEETLLSLPDASHPQLEASTHEAGSEADVAVLRPPSGAVVASSGTAIQSWCAVTLAGEVECWGDNTYGELGNGGSANSSTPVEVMNLPSATAVSVGSGTACAVTEAGSVMCWGNGSFGGLGNGTVTQPGIAQPLPVQVSGLTSDVVAISVGYGSACAVKKDGTVWCWGTLGEGDGIETTTHEVPVQIQGLPSAVNVSVGFDTACALSSTGDAMCWGDYGGTGLLGNGNIVASSSPVQVMGLTSGVTSLSVGVSVACAVVNGAVMCWGDGEEGELGNGSSLMSSPVPVQVMELTSGVLSVAAGEDTVCALKIDGTVWCWGIGSDGQLGTGSVVFSVEGPEGPMNDVPTQVPGLSHVTALSTGNAPCAVLDTGGVSCWGMTAENAANAVSVALLASSTQPAVATDITIGGDEGSAFACATISAGTLECWGNGLQGELANDSQSTSNAPVLSSSNLFKAGVTAVSASPFGDFACAVASGIVACWGQNQNGQLGSGNTSANPSPAHVTGLPDHIRAVSAGGTAACALTETGAVYCWGSNAFGQLGTGSTTSSLVPVLVTGLPSGVVAIAAGYTWACALLPDGTVDCWGDNSLGQLGNGSNDTGLVPTPIPGLSDVTSIAAGSVGTSCATTMAGNVLCWGYGMDCELGNVTCTSSNSPVQVQANGTDVSGATQVAVGFLSACAIIDAQAWCWGTEPALGNNAFSPLYQAAAAVPVMGITGSVTNIAVGHSSACAIASGALTCWGLNSAGQLGNGGAANDLVPTAIVGFP